MKKAFSPEELAEIREDWKRNGDLGTEDRLERVAQLHACGQEDIARALDLEKKPEVQAKHIRRRADPEIRQAAVKDVLLEGMTPVAVAEKYGMNPVTIRKWVAQARKTRQEFLDYPEAAENPTHAAADVPQNAPGVLDVPTLPCRSSAAYAQAEESGKKRAAEKQAPSMEILAERANQLYSAVEGAQCLWDEAYHYRALSPSDLDALADIIDRMRHFQLGFEAGLAAARGETEAGSRREAAQSPVPRDNWDSFPG